MAKIFRCLRRDDSGATAIEYGLIAALVSAALIAGATTLGNTLDSALNKIGSNIATSGKI
ncbi:Flp family type IVb pilin [Ensifer adhaerens]|jgi:pilus assembly protein Flp/PilA|uniref:Flp family type IVb pilin n=1 Tax=Ensifer TaxID=106591 RepID=UPI000DE27B03|nr:MULTISPECIES: Flp family type IVb pilin [Ensifer]MBK5565655.1 Flp family type IVb pilin [Ensifer sp. SSB1]MBZ7923843.1 Flp family type IVb pilin [Ensifer adhaerens]UAX92384.1 Flp family type IVb pilin [Ensifer adhaerens]UAY00018.1 Flp family type IVb pilin [Ensifer adhaerens]UAY07401.1 Flp family type IVb pilin [Ensifer adhaerens]